MSAMTRMIRSAVLVTGAAVVVDVALFVIAVVSLLSNGPTPTGYGWLAAANHTARVVAVLIAITAVLLALRGHRRVTAWLVGATSATIVGSVGLRVVGLALANANVAHSQQAESADSLFLALVGTGGDLMLLPIAFAAAGIVTFAVARTRARSGAGVAAQPIS